MSFTAVIVTEDPTNNGYVLTPLVRALLAACGKPKARVSVLSNPRTTGYEHAKAIIRAKLIDQYKYIDLLLFLPDSDGKDRLAEFEALETEARQKGTRLLCCAAVQEVEAWLLAGHLDRLEASWASVRDDPSVKENTFAPFLKRFGDTRKPGSGREDLMRETLRNFEGLKMRCPEIANLQERIRALVTIL